MPTEKCSKYGWWNEYVEAMVRYGTHKEDEGKYTKGFSRGAMVDYMRHYFHNHLEDYYRRAICPIMMLPGEDVFENQVEKAVMEGLRGLTERGEIVEVSGWVHPYGWLLDPEGVSKAILKFLNEKAH
jgi:hypothetical protein